MRITYPFSVISNIKFIDYEVALCEEYYIKRLTRDKTARNNYFNDLRLNEDINGLFMLDIIRKGIKNYDEIL